jgi:hypothetical protein
MKAPLRVPTNTRTLLMSDEIPPLYGSCLGFDGYRMRFLPNRRGEFKGIWGNVPSRILPDRFSLNLSNFFLLYEHSSKIVARHLLRVLDLGECGIGRRPRLEKGLIARASARSIAGKLTREGETVE